MLQIDESAPIEVRTAAERSDWSASTYLVHELARVAQSLGSYMMILSQIRKEIPDRASFDVYATHIGAKATDWCSSIYALWRDPADDGLLHIQLQKNRHGHNVEAVANVDAGGRLVGARAIESRDSAA
jgi:hypothetical protein